LGEVVYTVKNPAAFRAIKADSMRFFQHHAAKCRTELEGHQWRRNQGFESSKSSLEAMGLLPYIFKETTLILKGDKLDVPPPLVLFGANTAEPERWG